MSISFIRFLIPVTILVVVILPAMASAIKCYTKGLIDDQISDKKQWGPGSNCPAEVDSCYRVYCSAVREAVEPGCGKCLGEMPSGCKCGDCKEDLCNGATHNNIKMGLFGTFAVLVALLMLGNMMDV